MKTRRITGRYDPGALRAVLRSQPKISCAPGEGLDILLSTPVALYALTPSEYKDAVFPLVKTDPGTWTRLRSGEMKQDTVPYSALSILTIFPLADAEIELRGTGPKMPVAAFDRGRHEDGRPTAVLMPSVVSGPANDGAKAFYDARRLGNEMAAKLWNESKKDGPI